jgi:hypothetical protein
MLRELSAIAAWGDLDQLRELIDAALREAERNKDEQ